MRITPRSTTTRTLPRVLTAAVGAVGLLAVSACATNGEAQDTMDNSPADQTTQPVNTATETDGTTTSAAADDAELTATMNNADGSELGTAEFNETDGAVEIGVELSGMEPGFYGLHIHQIGTCEPDSAAPDDPDDTGDFMSAGSHIGSDESEHPDHTGDLPQLLVKESGDAMITFETDRLSLSDLEDEDGSALMIHSNPDNYANIPDRYAPDGVDEETLSTGDAGSRLACGVIGG